MVIFHSYVNVYQRVIGVNEPTTTIRGMSHQAWGMVIEKSLWYNKTCSFFSKNVNMCQLFQHISTMIVDLLDYFNP